MLALRRRARSGRRCAAPEVDKHSTGGVGDKISLRAGAARSRRAALTVPMIAGRGLGHTGGTLDKLEAIPGLPHRADHARDSGACWRAPGFVLVGQTARLAPADKRAVRAARRHRTVESIPLIAASILSKKLAEGIDGAGARRQGRRGRVHADARARARAGADAGRAGRARRACRCARC